jgi:ferredoxin
MPTVEFLDAGKQVNCGQYANLRKVAMLHDVEVYKGIWQKLNCHGNGLCAKCVVEVVDGAGHLSPKTLRERLRLAGAPTNYRLSCQCQVWGDVACIMAPALDDVPAAGPAKA